MAAQDEDGRWQQKTASRQVAEETRQAGRQAEGRKVRPGNACGSTVCMCICGAPVRIGSAWFWSGVLLTAMLSSYLA